MKAIVLLKVGVAVAALFASVAVGTPVVAAGSPATASSIPTPVQGRPYGKSYAEWAALWWQWALQIPASVNPLTDATGAFCTVGQRGDVWFLAGVAGAGEVQRACQIPEGVALLFPLVNSFFVPEPGEPAYGLYPGDPRLAKFASQLRGKVACTTPARRLSLWIDGNKVPNLERFDENSKFFPFQLPADNLFGIPPLLLTPSVDSGYYLIFRPLSAGKHTLHWIAKDGCSPPGSQDVTYHLTVGAS